MDAWRLGNAVGAYYAEVGLDVPKSDFAGFEANATLSFTYPVEDLDLDGHDDVVLHSYCVDVEACDLVTANAVPALGDLPAPDSPPVEGPDRCAMRHKLLAVSGATGEILWSRPMSSENRTVSADPADALDRLYCDVEFVVGTVPSPRGGWGLLVYGWQAYVPTQTYRMEQPSRQWLTVHHELYLLQARSNERVWTRNSTGMWVTLYPHDGWAWAARGENVLANPLLSVPNWDGVDVLPPTAVPSLFLQEVSFDYYAKSGPRLPGESAQCPTCNHYNLLEWYAPREWAVRLDLTNGAELWRQPTFSPEAGRSVVPDAFQRPPIPSLRRWPYRMADVAGLPAVAASDLFWLHFPCCWDVTGDGTNDLVFRTEEWAATPPFRPSGPFGLDARLAVYDGQTGKPVWSRYLVRDTQRFIDPEIRLAFWSHAYLPFFKTAGDVNGDGAMDLVIHETFLHESFRHNVTVLDGRTGDELWKLSSGRYVLSLVLGDADGDRGSDLAMFEWPLWEWPMIRSYHAANVTHTLVSIQSGATGRVIWARPTLNAPVDLAAMYFTLLRSGVPDIDGDGVGDLPIDDPIYLADLTLVHDVSYVSGRTGEELHRIPLVGTFAFATFLGDMTGDGRDDFGFLNGDVTDLWLTSFDGANGSALWSRRILRLGIADAVQSLPMLRVHPLHVRGEAAQAPLLNFEMVVQTVRPSFGDIFTFHSVYPVLAKFDGAGGGLMWSLPAGTEGPHDAFPGHSPATEAFLRMYYQELHRPGPASQALQNVYGPPLGIALFFATAAAAGIGGPWRWLRK